jgi:hypothetical protein
MLSFTKPPPCSSGQSSWLQNGDILRFLWGTNWIYICYVEESRLPLWSSGQSSWLQNGVVLCFLRGRNWIYICYVEERLADWLSVVMWLLLRFRPSLWCSGQGSCLQFQRSGFDFRHYQIFWEVVGLVRGPLILINTTEALLERNNSGSGLEIREYDNIDPLCCPHGAQYQQIWH